MRLGQAEVFLNLFTGDAPLSDVISRHPVDSWPDLDPPEERAPGWAGSVVEERTPPGEPSPFWYQVGPGGLFYWQWAAVGLGAVALLSVGDGRRRR